MDSLPNEIITSIFECGDPLCHECNPKISDEAHESVLNTILLREPMMMSLSALPEEIIQQILRHVVDVEMDKHLSLPAWMNHGLRCNIPPPASEKCPAIWLRNVNMYRRRIVNEKVRTIAKQDTVPHIRASLLPIACSSYRFKTSALTALRKAEKTYQRRRTEALLTLFFVPAKPRTHDVRTAVSDRAGRYSHHYRASSLPRWQIIGSNPDGSEHWWWTHDGVTYMPGRTRRFLLPLN